MAFEKNRVRAAVLALPLAVGLSLGAATAAQAATFEEDDRATIHEGNAKTCADVDLGGSVIVQVDGEKDFNTELIQFGEDKGELNDDQYLDILSVEKGVEVTGIVVKGGDAANVYVPGENGLNETSWMELRSPLNKGDNIPQISHWYVCGSYTPPETTTTTTTTETTTTTDSSETSTPSSEPTTSVPTSEETTTSETSDVTATSIVDTAPPSESTTSEAPVFDNKNDSDDLAVTGFGSSWLIWAGVLFLVAGVGAIAGVRVLRKQ